MADKPEIDNEVFRIWLQKAITPRDRALESLLLIALNVDVEKGNAILAKAKADNYVDWSVMAMIDELESAKIDVSAIEAHIDMVNELAHKSQLQPPPTKFVPGGDEVAENPQPKPAPRPVSALSALPKAKVADESGDKAEGEDSGKEIDVPIPRTFKSRPLPSVESEVESAKKKSENLEAKPKFKFNKKTILIVGSVVVLLVLASFFLLPLFLGGGSPSFDDSFDSGPSFTPGFESTQTPSPLEGVETSGDDGFWYNLRNLEVPELSPGNLGGQLNAKTIVGIFLTLAVMFFAYFEGRARLKSQQSSLFFSVVGIVSGLVTIPAFVYMSKTPSMGSFVLVVLILTALWALTVSTIWSQSDLSPTTVALAIFTSSLFYYGKLPIVTAVGRLFGATWNTWEGVTTVGGVLTLFVSGRFQDAILTILIIFLSILVIVLASNEVGKKHGQVASYIIGISIAILFYLINWLFNSGVLYLVDNYGIPVAVEVILRILAPAVAWLLSLLAAVGIGTALGDTEIGFTENKQKMGLQKSGTYIQTMSDFLILGTVIPLFLGVVLRFW